MIMVSVELLTAGTAFIGGLAGTLVLLPRITTLETNVTWMKKSLERVEAKLNGTKK